MQSQLSRIITHFEEGIIGLLLAAMTLVYFGQVVARYVFNSGGVWVVELTTYLFAWMVLFGASYGVKIGSHIGVDILTRHFPPLMAKISAVIVCLLGISYCVLMFIGSWEYVGLIYDLEIEAEDLPIQQWVAYSILPISMVLIAFRFTEIIVNILRGKEVHMLADEVKEALEDHKKAALLDAAKNNKGETV